MALGLFGAPEPFPKPDFPSPLFPAKVSNVGTGTGQVAAFRQNSELQFLPAKEEPTEGAGMFIDLGDGSFVYLAPGGYYSEEP